MAANFLSHLEIFFPGSDSSYKLLLEFHLYYNSRCVAEARFSLIFCNRISPFVLLLRSETSGFIPMATLFDSIFRIDWIFYYVKFQLG